MLLSVLLQIGQFHPIAMNIVSICTGKSCIYFCININCILKAN